MARNRNSAFPTSRRTITIDTVTDKCVRHVAEKEGLSYSQALCNMTLYAARNSADTYEVIKEMLKQAVETQMIDNGIAWSPDLSTALAEDLLLQRFDTRYPIRRDSQPTEHIRAPSAKAMCL